MTPEISIVMVTYNCEHWIDPCLDSIPKGLGSRSAEIIIVDNASSDRSADAVASRHPTVTLLRNETNVGFAAAVNQAASRASAPWILLLNPDTKAKPDTFDNLLSFAEKNPRYGLYGGRTLDPGGWVQPSSCWALPTLWSTACFAFGLTAVLTHNPVFDPESMGHWKRDSVREVGMITGCLLLVSRAVWDELGGMNERYFLYGEDADFAARARANGYRPVITPDAELIHEIGASSSDEGAKVILLLAGKITYIQANWHGLRAKAGVSLLRLGALLHATGSRLTGRGGRWRAAWAKREKWWNGYP